MQAALVTHFDEPPHVTTIPDPIAGTGQVLVQVHAAAIHPVVRAIASGKHYASPKTLPAMCGLDGVGRLPDGTRVYFGPVHPPHGTVAERVAVLETLCTPIPDDLDDAMAAALPNPGMAAWMPLFWRAKLAPGESVCILGATGAAGQLAVRAARLLGAGRVVAAGRNAATLATLDADALINLDQPDAALVDSFAREAGADGFDVMVDYLWGAPTEALLKVIGRAKFAKEMRLVQVGESAGSTLNLPGSVLRSTGLAILGFGIRSNGFAPRDIQTQALRQLFEHASAGRLRLDVERIALDSIETAWKRSAPRGGRLVVII